MIKFLKGFHFFFLIFLFPNISSANIAFIDIDYLFENSNIGQKIKSNLEIIQNEHDKFLKSKEDELIEAEEELRNKKNIISQDEFDKNYILLKKG